MNISTGSQVALMDLALSWEQIARQRFECEQNTDDTTGKHVMSSTAMAYFNCAAQVREALAVTLPQPLTIPLVDQA